MKRKEFLVSFAEIVEIPAGTLNGTEDLDSLENWNSLAVISFIAFADERLGTAVSNAQLSNCKTVDDVARLLGVQDS